MNEFTAKIRGGGIVRQILVRGTILFLFFLQFVDFYNSGVKKISCINPHI